MRDRIIALGFFDGVHLGHGGLLKRTRELADQQGMKAAALTFDTHPDELVFGEKVPLLNTPEEREYLMKSIYGIDELLPLHFDRDTMSQPWENFVVTLGEKYRGAHVVCGQDFRFGAGGQGTPEKLNQKCMELGIGCDCIPEITMEGETISSTLIRKLLLEGKTEKAVRFLGHPHIISGAVTGGRKIGRTLGIPTANLHLKPGILVPKFGVYTAKAYVDGQELPAVVNIGTRPTVDGHRVTVEPWLLDFNGDLYGEPLRLELYAFLREEKKFDSLEELRTEILKNAEETREFFKK